MPLFKPNPIREFRTDILHGTIDSLLFKSEITSLPQRAIKIYKPVEYENLTDLPCLYINDGLEALEFCSYNNILDNLIADKKIAPVIVVFIECKEGDSEYYINKTDEYTTAICDELLPLIEKKYRTSQSPTKRVASGISAGAHIALLTPLKRPDKFLNAAGQSTTITNELIEEVENGAGNNKAFRFYFDVGRFDLLSGAVDNQPFLYLNQGLHKQMKRLKLNHTLNVFNDGHQWANWRERVDEILIYFFGIGSEK
jgi:enterochelin esterase family protein